MKSKIFITNILLSIGAITTTITTFSCSSNASSENDSSNNKPPTDNDLPNNPEQPTPPITPEEPKPPVTPEHPTPPITPEEPKPPVIEEEKDNWNSFPSDESIKINSIKSIVLSDVLYISIEGENLSINIDEYKLVFNENKIDIKNYIKKLEFALWHMAPTSNKILLAIWFKDDNGILEGMKLLSGKKYIILINGKAPVRGPDAISSNIFPALIELYSVSILRTEYDKNNEPTSLIFEVKGKNLFMDYINNTPNEKIIISVEGYKLSFDYEFLSDLSNTNQFVVKITPPLGTIKKLSGKNYIFRVINAWGYTHAVANYFPNF